MNPAGLTPSSLTESRIALQSYLDDPAFSARMHHAARRDRALAIGRLAVRLVGKLAALRPVSNSSAQPMSLPFARWG